MKTPAISFVAKHRFEYSKPKKPLANPGATQPTLDAAILRYESQQKLKTAINQAKQSLKALPNIKNASDFAIKKSNDILYEAKEIQATANKLMNKIKETEAYRVYLDDKQNRRELSFYPLEVEFGDKLFDVTIYPNKKITAVERIYPATEQFYRLNGSLGAKEDRFGKEIYEFGANTSDLMYYAKNHRTMGTAKAIDKEFKFFDDGILHEYNEGVSKGEFELIQQRFKFRAEEDNSIYSFATMVKTYLDKEYADRVFEYDHNKELTCFIKDYKEGMLGYVQGDLLYKFEDEKLRSLQKNYCEGENYTTADMKVEFNNENEFAVYVDYDTRTDSIYTSSCFYKAAQD